MKNNNVQNNSEKKIGLVIDCFKKFGTPNPQYQKDLDMTYGALFKKLDGKVDGLQVVLKSMRTNKLVDFRDNFLKEDSIITYIIDPDQEVTFLGISKDQIAEAYKKYSDPGGHQKIASENS